MAEPTAQAVDEADHRLDSQPESQPSRLSHPLETSTSEETLPIVTEVREVAQPKVEAKTADSPALVDNVSPLSDHQWSCVELSIVV